MGEIVSPDFLRPALTEAELTAAKAYIRPPEGDDEFVASCVIAARAYLEGAGVSMPKLGTLRRELYDMVAHAHALAMYDHRDLVVSNALGTNPVLRQMLNQLKFTEVNFPVADGAEEDTEGDDHED